MLHNWVQSIKLTYYYGLQPVVCGGEGVGAWKSLKNKIYLFFSIEIDFKNNFCAINIVIESGHLQTTGVAIYRPWLKNLGSLELK